MAQDYKTYLAANVLSESRTVSYRSLSRALKVHNNLAKQMLFEFHHHENTKKPGTVHATYFLSGTRRAEKPLVTNGFHEKDSNDVPMQDSSFMSSSMPQQDAEEEVGVPTKTIMLVAEEDLEEAKALFEDLQSLHIYSLQPTPLTDLHVLTDIGREISTTYAKEDPLEYGKKYGVIQNKSVKRRTGRRPLPAPVTSASNGPVLQARASKPADAKQEAKSKDVSSRPGSRSDDKKDLQGSKVQSKSKAQPSQRSNSKSSDKAPAMKRDTSDIFKSFAKSKPKMKREGTDSSAVESAAESAEPSAVEDTDMKDASEEEEDDEHYLDKVVKPSTAESGKSRKERREELRKLMDDDDEPMTDSQDAPTEDIETPEANTSQEAQKIEPEEPTVVVQGGRRRGRRQVKKKMTVKDEEGYLVTKEELVWESFSEDEPAPPKPKSSGFTSSGASKAGKSGAKGTQGKGNIMSFFSKK